MRKRLIAFAFYSLFWLLFFILARLLFLLAQFRELVTYSSGTILNTFINGFKPDVAVICYFLIIPMLAAIPGLYYSQGWYRIFIRIYSYILIITCSALLVGDAIVYPYWGLRLEFFIVEYLKTPADAAASASTLQVILFVCSLLLLAGFFIFLYNKVIDRYISSFAGTESPLTTAIILFILSASLIIPIRGGVSGPPLRPGSAYFSKELFPNHAAVNIIWNFGYSAIHFRPSVNPYIFHKPDDAGKDFEMLTRDKGPVKKILNQERPNILIVILESFGRSIMEEDSPGMTVTPEFRKLIPEGIYFSNIYASGSRTERALPSIFSGYPNLPAIQVIMESKKTESMPGIVKLLDSAGYKTSFWYGGDLNFANMNSYITGSAFREKISVENFNAEDRESKWGVHDEVLFDMLFDSLSVSGQPFAYAALTLSSHEPFEVPMKPVFTGRDVLTRFRNSIYYTDKSLGQFISRARTTAWWKNTLVILVADHGRRNSVNIPVYSEEIFKIPMLWTGGAVEGKSIRINKYGNQFDIPLTVARQLNLEGSFPFSKDLLSDGSHSFAFYTFNEGFTFITDTTSAIFDIRLKGCVTERGENPASAEKLGKSFLQILYDDYLKR